MDLPPPDRQTDSRPSSPLRQALRLAHRRRRELAPIVTAVGLLLVTLAAHAAAPASWWAALPLGGGATAGLALRADRNAERVFVLAVGGGATLWAALAWGLGPSPDLLGALPALALPAAVLWWRHQLPRSRIEVVRPSVRPRGVGEWLSELRFARRSRAELARIMADWPRTAESAKVPGSVVRRAVADRTAYTLHIDLRRGQTHAEMTRRLPELGSALAAVKGTVRVEPDKRMDRVRVRWVHDDPLAAPVTCWRPYDPVKPAGRVVASITEPLELGVHEHGGVARLRLADNSHLLICGATRWGKSSIANVIVGSLAGAADAVLWAVDPKGGVELGPWGGVIDRLTDRRGALAMLRAARRVIEARQGVLLAAGRKEWGPALGPYLVLVLDEFPRLSARAMDEATALVQLGGFVGLRVVVIAQSPSAEALGGSVDLRDNLLVVISTHLKGERAAGQAFGTGARESGWDPARLPAPGYFLLKAPSIDDPAPARAYYPDTAAIEEVRERWEGAGHALDAASAAAAAPRDGDEAEWPGLRLVPEGSPREEEPAAGEDGDDDGPDDSERSAARLARLREAIRTAARPISGREAHRRAGLPRDWVFTRGLPELESRGEIEETNTGWRWLGVGEHEEGQP